MRDDGLPALKSRLRLWNQLTYVTGQLRIEDCSSGNILVAGPGDVVWIPQGASFRPIGSDGVEAFYAELSDRPGDELADSLYPRYERPPRSLQDWQRELVEQFLETNPKSKTLHDRASKVMPGGNTRAVLHSAPFPLAFESARGVMVRSVDGHEYLDFVSE